MSYVFLLYSAISILCELLLLGLIWDLQSEVGRHYFQILDSFDLVLNSLKAGDNIGFAVALQGGAFSVYRFSLSGALPAIQRAL